MKALLKTYGRFKFRERFGHSIEEYQAFQVAVESVGVVTMENYRRVLPYYFLYLGQNPDEVIAQRRADLKNDDPAQEEYYERKTKAYILELKQRGIAGKSIIGHLSRIQGFFRNNGQRYILKLGKLRISKARRTPKYSPTNADARAVLAKADCARDKLLVTLAVQTGPAPKDISLLHKGDIPLEPWRFVERSRSKTGEIWRFVTTPDLCEALRVYLEVRGCDGHEELFLGREGPLDSAGVSQVLAGLIEKAGFGGVVGFKPKSFRDSYEDALVEANTPPKIKKMLMGHSTGDIENEYGSYENLLRHCVDAVKKAYPLLCLSKVQPEVRQISDEKMAKIDKILDLFAAGKLRYVE